MDCASSYIFSGKKASFTPGSDIARFVKGEIFLGDAMETGDEHQEIIEILCSSD